MKNIKQLKELEDYLLHDMCKNCYDMTYEYINNIQVMKISVENSYVLSKDYIVKHTFYIFYSKTFKYEIHVPFYKIWLSRITKKDIKDFINNFHTDSSIEY